MQAPQTQEGASSRLERLFREEAARLERALVLYAGDREIARDALAEAFAQALRRGDDLKDPLAWVWRVSFRVAAGELKERGRLGQLPDAPYEIPEPARDLVQALSLLSPRQRAAVILHHYAGYSTREVAALIGSTPGAVTVHLVRGRRRLRQILEDFDD